MSAPCCILCGHEVSSMKVERPCGMAQANWNDATVFLCHAADHSCYIRWTVDGVRPS